MSTSAAEVRSGDQEFMISAVAQITGLHVQTLRAYDRAGLVSPRRSPGGGRRYSVEDVDVLFTVLRLSHQEKINLAGVKRIIELTKQVDTLQNRVVELLAQVDKLTSSGGIDQTSAPHSAALLVWRPRKGDGHESSYGNLQYAVDAR